MTAPRSFHLPLHPPSTDLERFEAVMKCLHTLGYYAPPVPWGEDPAKGMRLIPRENRGQYVYASERDFAAAFGDFPLPEDTLLPTATDAPPPTHGMTMLQPITLHWAGDGTVIARAFHDAGFFVRQQSTPAPGLRIGIRPFADEELPLWAPDAWHHLMDILRLLETQGYCAPGSPTLSLDVDTLPPAYVTFGVLEQTICRYGTFHDSTSASPTAPLKTPLFLTWQGDGIHIATTFRREGCQVWWLGEPHALIGVAPRPCNLTVLSPHFPPWQPPGA